MPGPNDLGGFCEDSLFAMGRLSLGASDASVPARPSLSSAARGFSSGRPCGPFSLAIPLGPVLARALDRTFGLVSAAFVFDEVLLFPGHFNVLPSHPQNIRLS